MKYQSTRGQAPALGFEEVLLAGLANDGGLYLPENLPKFTAAELKKLASLSYAELAFEVMAPFVAGEIADSDLRDMIDASYASFSNPAVTPLVQLEKDLYLLELFHGPTLAFKDVALQLLGRLFAHVLEKREQRVVILGATSGDTGSAAIEGCRHSDRVDIFILHPHEKVSNVQRRQMTTVDAPNVHNIAVEGNFDDCQSIVKACFAEQSFLPEGRQLVAVNSINWARIMAQIVYYFHAAFQLGAPEKAISFSVPTGNFGDIFAGYLAKSMGLPVDRLIIATNQNDILHRMLSDNDYSRRTLLHSLSPSMDIMVSSNFERLIFDLCGRDGAAVAGLMAALEKGHLVLPEDALARAQVSFDSARVDDEQTCNTIAEIRQKCNYLLDPHSAIGVYAAQQYQSSRAAAGQKSSPVVALATAHPAKFPDAIAQAGFEGEAALPPHMHDLFDRKETFSVLGNDILQVQNFVHSKCRTG